jgi:deazaflavin-dependent oxidoreductase (nitroreductase family)
LRPSTLADPSSIGDGASVRALQRAVLRAPIGFYRIGLGRLLGRRFLLLEHIGRRSGTRRQTVLEVVERDEEVPVVASGWGEGSDWVKNITANPTVHVTMAGRLFDAEAVRLDTPEAARVLDDYRKAHPRAARRIGQAIGVSLTSDPGKAASVLPLFRLVPIT